jgi:metallo-beta-lactamase family protein
MRVRFLGAAGFVAGSRTHVRWGDHHALVDCGLFQGFKELRQRNWQPLEVEARSLERVFLTHAHIDHSGWLPGLVRAGFDGPIHCTEGTAALLKIMLPDSGRIQEEDAARANRRRYTRHDPALPMFTEADARAALRQVEPVGWGQRVEAHGLAASFHPAGHILGASSVLLEHAGHRLLFSGDLGRDGDLLMRAPADPPAADTVILESTYGGRLHPDVDLLAALEDVVVRTAERGGTVLIPSFAVGRAQAVLWALHLLRKDGRIPRIPVVLDSPMAVDTTAIYRRHADDLRLDGGEVAALCRDVTFVRTRDQSKALNDAPGPMVLVSASGMLTGGRVLHHLSHRVRDRKNTVLFVGYQAPGTRGARMLGGEPRVRIHGHDLPVRCEVAVIDGLSAHADQQQLVDWLSRLPEPPRRVLLNHGEPDSIDALRQRIEGELRWPAEAAREGVVYDLVHDQPPRPLPPRAPGPRPYVLLCGESPLDKGARALRTALADDLAPHGIDLVVDGQPYAPTAGRPLAGVVALPGGFGTLHRVFGVLHQLQAGQAAPFPVVLVDAAFWEQTLPRQALLEPGALAPGMGEVLRMAADGDEARAWIQRWHEGGPGWA